MSGARAQAHRGADGAGIMVTDRRDGQHG